MTSMILRPLVVFVAGLVALTTQPSAAGASGAMDVCNTPIPSNCQQWSEDEMETVCNAICPNWEVAICFASNNFMCAADET